MVFGYALSTELWGTKIAIVDGDATWRPMVTAVSGPTFSYGGQTWTAPAGSYQGRTINHAGPGVGGAVTYTW